MITDREVVNFLQGELDKSPDGISIYTFPNMNLRETVESLMHYGKTKENRVPETADAAFNAGARYDSGTGD